MSAAIATGVKPQVTSGLNLVLSLKESDPEKRKTELRKLMAFLEQNRDKTNAALRRLNFVHFARFLPAKDGSTLSVITEFDGPLEPYVIDFVIAIGDVFTTILSYMKDWPVGSASANVRESPREFKDYVREHNMVHVQGMPPFADLHLYSAYPKRTVIDIIGPNLEKTDPFPS
jgi:hypothetical protein